MSSNDNEAVFTIAELVARWKTSRRSLYDAIAAGALRPFTIGRRVYRVTLEEVQRFERERARGAA